MGIIYILKGKCFGKDIYEIDYTTNIETRLTSLASGYPNDNKVLYSIEAPCHCTSQLDTLFADYVVQYHPFYQINIDTAKSMLQDFVRKLERNHQNETTKKTKLGFWKICM
jgi:hypothetical protein